MTARLLIAAIFAAVCLAIARMTSPLVVLVLLAGVGGVSLMLLLGGRAPHWRRDV